MRTLRVLMAATLLLGVARQAPAHPAPFTYLDLKRERDAIDVTLVAHDFDVAHDLAIEPPERLLEPSFVAMRAAAIIALLQPRLTIAVDGRTIAGQWLGVDAVPDRQSVRLHARYPTTSPPGVVRITTLMFPYDPVHQTFLNVYEGDSLTQAILDRGRTEFTYYAGTVPGAVAVAARFVPAGFRHIVLGPDHLVFLLGLFLLGGTIPRLALIVTAFAVGNAATLTLAALNIASPPLRYIEPALALSIVYVGADNLLVHAQKAGPAGSHEARDMRVWIAAVFGFIHGFGFAPALGGADLTRRALTWSIVSFNVGIEIGQLVCVVAAGAALVWVRSRYEAAGRGLVVAGSIAVVLAGSFWFVQRVFFPS